MPIFDNNRPHFFHDFASRAQPEDELVIPVKAQTKDTIETLDERAATRAAIAKRLGATAGTAQDYFVPHTNRIDEANINLPKKVVEVSLPPLSNEEEQQ